MSADLTNPIFKDETAARKYLEALRWPDQVSCPHCGSLDGITKLAGKTTRPGLFACSSCRGQFSVTVGTVYERSHIPLHKWLLATHLMSSSKKGISARQLHRMLEITYKSASQAGRGVAGRAWRRRALVKVDRTNIRTIREIVGKNMSRKSKLMTDDAHMYKAVTVDEHKTVNHSKGEYGYGNVHTNTIEGLFSIFKRGMKGPSALRREAPAALSGGV